MDYELGLAVLGASAKGTPWYQDFTLLEARLREVLREERRYGPSPQSNQDQFRVIAELNALAFEHLKVSFNDLCKGVVPNNIKSSEGGKPMKILFLAANPRETNQLGLDVEIRTIDERLRLAEYREKFDLVSHWAVRTSDLTGLLLRHKPHIVHFSGHGSSKGKIILEDNAGQAKEVSAAALSRLFRTLKDNIRCVVLNACYSATQAEAISQEIDFVVGMSRAVADDAAVRFAAGFYSALGFGRTVQTAFDLGVAEIELELEGLGQEDIPKITMKQGVDPAAVTLAQ